MLMATVSLAAVISVSAARAEFTVGSRIPIVSLPAVDGSRIELVDAGGMLALRGTATESKPKVLVIHLLQPDCLQCSAQLKDLQTLNNRYAAEGVVVLGIAHRGDVSELQSLGKDIGITFPLLFGVGSEIATQFAAGDTLGIVDQTGVVRFAQVGFGKGDESLWAKAIDELLAGKAVSKSGVDRERLAVGDRFPAVELPSLMSGKPMALVGRDGRLAFRDENGKETQPKGAVGFFSRY